MKLNYTQKLIASLVGYSCLLMLFTFSIVWLMIEASEEDASAGASAQTAIAIALQHSDEGHNTFVTDDYTVYFNEAELPEIIRQALTSNQPEALTDTPVYVGINPANQQRYYVVSKATGLGDFFIAEFDDMVFILMAVVLATLILFIMATKMARQLAEPVVSLTHSVQNLSAEDTQFPTLSRDDEIGQLSRAFGNLFNRMQAFALRERDFTRFASHELRSPAAVIRGNIDLLKKDGLAPEVTHRAISRLDAASHRITLLINAFLYLGRESERLDETKVSPLQKCDLENIVNLLLEHAGEQNRERIQWHVASLDWNINSDLLNIVLDNLIRNATQHSTGCITLAITASGINISNAIDNELEQSRQGIGLQIIERICELNHWGYNVASNEQRFTVTIEIAPFTSTTST
ncbi:HAMP domain-containing sensor histidine kinase [uncultured Gilvimarinus sp.]|uniref:sensor histidine kinase n=1 Tax=uncultured Gilvimarinus sp. TaxID=1689143 RepID=UPI0030D77C45